MRRLIGKLPVIGPLLRTAYRSWIHPPASFPGSNAYWRARYASGGTSGHGSYDRLAEFKADTLNAFAASHDIRSVIEYGCGDGNQLSLARYPRYLGYDVSPDAVARCRERFAHCDQMSFLLADEYAGETADLTLSLDVIYHLIEDHVFEQYMARLFDSSKRFVAIYSSNTDDNPQDVAAHVRHRRFSRWVEENRPLWTLVQHIPNKYPFTGAAKTGSFADFYFYATGGSRE